MNKRKLAIVASGCALMAVGIWTLDTARADQFLRCAAAAVFVAAGMLLAVYGGQ